MKNLLILITFAFALVTNAATFEFSETAEELTPKNIIDSLLATTADEASDFSTMMNSFDVGFADSAIDQVKGAIERGEEVFLGGSGGFGGYNLQMAIPVYYGYKSTTELVGWAFYEVTSAYNPETMETLTKLTFKASNTLGL
jgi:hypothetical protein